jgi:hypothetical protein
MILEIVNVYVPLNGRLRMNWQILSLSYHKKQLKRFCPRLSDVPKEPRGKEVDDLDCAECAAKESNKDSVAFSRSSYLLSHDILVKMLKKCPFRKNIITTHVLDFIVILIG